MVIDDSYAGYDSLLDPITVWPRSEAPMEYKASSPFKGEEDLVIRIDSKLIKAEDFTKISNIVENTDVAVRMQKHNLIIYSKYDK
jgi:hypothetical protein